MGDNRGMHVPVERPATVGLSARHGGFFASLHRSGTGSSLMVDPAGRTAQRDRRTTVEFL
ncbi:hypothetical protein RHCRD62_60130 [Rhodococcus sp. RD6.2]|nr:hypothetical protein RHCRD62_60130 [Rhodococcus sp. RD6.2]